MILDEEDIVSKEEMKLEAIKRMKKLNIRSTIIKKFEEEDKLLCVKAGKIIDVPTEILNKIRDWEKEFGNLAYYVVFSELYGCEIYNALSVSLYSEDWNYENSLIDNMFAMAYTINITFPSFSESGLIRLVNYYGLLQRIQ